MLHRPCHAATNANASGRKGEEHRPARASGWEIDGSGCGSGRLREVVYLAPDTIAMVERGGIGDGRLFRSLRSGRPPGAKLDASQISRIFKTMARRAGLPEQVVAGLSGPSARVGAAQGMIASGI